MPLFLDFLVTSKTTWYVCSCAGNVTRVVTGPESTGGIVLNMSMGGPSAPLGGGCSPFQLPRTATRFIYTDDGQEVQYVLGETWCSSGGLPVDYHVTYGREFRYDGARQRYLDRNLDPAELEDNLVVDLTTPVWSDYDGDVVYGDWEIDAGAAAERVSYQPGMGRTDT
jgi:hypothetical protein